MKRILFISHEASRSGAPLILLRFIQWLRKNKPEIKIDVLVLRGGELKDDFKKVAGHFYDLPKSPGIMAKVKKRILRSGEVSNLNNKQSREIKAREYDLIYANSILAVRFASKLKYNRPGTKFIAHIHELDTVIKLILPDLEKYITDFNSIIVPADLVKQNLISNYGISPQKIDVIREFSEVPGTDNPVKTTNNKFVVGASGTIHWRKGPDIFLLVAAYVKRNYPELPIEFRWVGKLPESQKPILEADIRKLGVADCVSFIGERIEPFQEYRQFDLFLLPSREDPFPLVCIELGMLETPVICFEKATGIAEVLEYEGGSVIPYLNVGQMAEEVIKYQKDSLLLRSQGQKCKEVFSQFLPEKICPHIFQLLTNLTNQTFSK